MNRPRPYFALFLVLASGRAPAAEIVLWPPTHPFEIWISGEIKIGDDRKFTETLLQANGDVHTVQLNSPGGDVATAIAIGQTIRSYYLGADAPVAGRSFMSKVDHPDSNRIRRLGDVVGEVSGNEVFVSQCDSACALIWVAGVERSGTTLGLHRPYFDRSWFAGLSAEEAASRYGVMLQNLRTYLHTMGVSDATVERLCAIPSDEVRYDEQFVAELNGEPTAVAEWLIARCGASLMPLFAQRTQQFLEGKQADPSVDKTITTLRECRYQAMAEARAQAFAKQRGKPHLTHSTQPTARSPPPQR